jgi:hypothetical protein
VNTVPVLEIVLGSFSSMVWYARAFVTQQNFSLLLHLWIKPPQSGILLIFWSFRLLHYSQILDLSGNEEHRQTQQAITVIREPLLKWKAQNNWPSCANRFRSAAFGSTNFIYFIKKQATLVRRSTILSLPLQLVFPAVIYVYFWRGRLSTIDLLALTDLDHLLLAIQTLFTLLQNKLS